MTAADVLIVALIFALGLVVGVVLAFRAAKRWAYRNGAKHFAGLAKNVRRKKP